MNNPNYGSNKKGTKEVAIAVPLKYLGNFWNSLNIPLANCKVSLALSWSSACVIISTEKRILVAGQPNRVILQQMQLLRLQTQKCMFH